MKQTHVVGIATLHSFGEIHLHSSLLLSLPFRPRTRTYTFIYGCLSVYNFCCIKLDHNSSRLHFDYHTLWALVFIHLLPLLSCNRLEWDVNVSHI